MPRPLCSLPSGLAILCLTSIFAPAHAETFAADSYVLGSLCVGTACVPSEPFGYDTIRLSAPAPRMLFEDTSSSGSFPSNDWSLGVEPTADMAATRFILRDISADVPVMQLESDVNGGIALGANAEMVSGAISVGAAGTERRIAHVADAIEQTDAVTLGQFDAFKTTYASQITETDTELALLDDEISDLESEVELLKSRLDTLNEKFGN